MWLAAGSLVGRSTHSSGRQTGNVMMSSRQALAYIRQHGVVLESAQGPVPSLAEAIAGEPIRGSWWSHCRGREIFAVTRAVRDSDQVLVCRLIKNKVTLVHRRLWPALVRAAGRLPSDRLAQVREMHTRSGRHVTSEVPFPDWVPSSVRAAARSPPEKAALAEVAAWIEVQSRTAQGRAAAGGRQAARGAKHGSSTGRG